MKAAFRMTVAFGILSLLTLVAIFLAATDIWHEQGSPNFWRGQGTCSLEWQIIGYGWWLLLAFHVAFLATAPFVIKRWRQQKFTDRKAVK
jgi:hypothetical protein